MADKYPFFGRFSNTGIDMNNGTSFPNPQISPTKPSSHNQSTNNYIRPLQCTSEQNTTRSPFSDSVPIDDCNKTNPFLGSNNRNNDNYNNYNTSYQQNFHVKPQSAANPFSSVISEFDPFQITNTDLLIDPNMNTPVKKHPRKEYSNFDRQHSTGRQANRHEARDRGIQATRQDSGDSQISRRTSYNSNVECLQVSRQIIPPTTNNRSVVDDGRSQAINTLIRQFDNTRDTRNFKFNPSDTIPTNIQPTYLPQPQQQQEQLLYPPYQYPSPPQQQYQRDQQKYSPHNQQHQNRNQQHQNQYHNQQHQNQYHNLQHQNQNHNHQDQNRNQQHQNQYHNQQDQNRNQQHQNQYHNQQDQNREHQYRNQEQHLPQNQQRQPLNQQLQPTQGKNRGNEKKVFWKDKQLESTEDQLMYIGHCRSWCKPEHYESYVVEKIREAIEPLESILEVESLDHDVIRQLIDLLSRPNFLTPHSSCCQSANNILSKIIDSKLIQSSKNLSGFLTDVFEEIDEDKFLHGKGPLNDNMKLVHQVTLLLKTLIERLPSEFQSLNVCITTLKDKFLNPVCAMKFSEETQICIVELHTKYAQLKKKDKEALVKHREMKQFEDDDAYYGDYYFETSILPTHDELLKANPISLRKLIKTGSYPDALKYIDMHFKLLREDMVRPLREGIQHFISNSNSKGVRKELYIYDKVKIVEMHCDQNQGLLYKISFMPFGMDPTKIKWDRSPRLKFGTLLLITSFDNNGKPDFFKFLWAVVANRDEKELLKDLTISIKFDKNSYQPNFEFGVEYFMVESKQVYYEAYYHTLSVLQNMKPECLPLQAIILGQQKQVEHPQYLTQTTVYNFGEVFLNTVHGYRVLGSWPQLSSILDESQLRALKLALTKEVALIQGPPGTGKTYVGAHTMRILLETRRNLISRAHNPEVDSQDLQTDFRERIRQPALSSDDLKLHKALCQVPILIVTYTNHALDQFLEYLLGFESKIIRIGSKVDREELKSKALKTVSKEVMSQPNLPPEVRKFKHIVYDLRKEMDSKKNAIKDMSTILTKDYLTKEDFEKLVTEQQFKSLFSQNDEGFQIVTGSRQTILEAWLGQNRSTPNSTPSQSGGAAGGSTTPKEKKKDKKTKSIQNSNRFAALAGMDEDNEDDDVLSVDDIQRKRLKNFGFDISDESQSQTQTFSNSSLQLENTCQNATFTNIEFTPAGNATTHQVNSENSYMGTMEYTLIDEYNSTVHPNQIFQLGDELIYPENSLIPLEDGTFLHHGSDDEDEVDIVDTSETLDIHSLTIADAMQLYGNNQEGAPPTLDPRILNCKNLWLLSPKDRKHFYNYLLLTKKNEVSQVLSALSTDYSDLSIEYKEKQRQLDAYVLKQAAVVGMTTTGAARNTELLKELKPKIIFIEEAAEVLEAHVIACLSEHVQHLILIGDHQQLQPSNAVHELTQKYNLALSLFERLVCCEVEHVTLSNQHRMRPEISRLIKPIYPNLIDHPVVFNRPPINGVMKNVFFIDHRIPEDALDADVTSRKNIHEAKFIAHFAKYLLKQGYTSEDLTILTFYLQQKFRIMDHLKLIAKGSKIRVTTVDRFQGEENKIILFSVVRSNFDNDIGHCRADNRVCVALSRAKDGFFLIGNSDCLKRAKSYTKLWQKVFVQLGADNIGTHLPLACQKHPDTISFVSSSPDFQKVKNGGCQLQCDERLECGHQCQQLCHPDGHENVECNRNCERVLNCGHSCYQVGGKILKKCYEECGECNVLLDKTLDTCNHYMKLPCHQPPTHNLCQVACIRMLPCMHRCSGKCGQECSLLSCFEEVNCKLLCNHDVKIKCWRKDNFLEVECKNPCTHVLECGDKCPGTCGSCLDGRKHKKCQNKCKAPLICQHECQENCHRPSVCLPCMQRCINRCMHTKCGRYCGEICVSCIEPCEWRCRHMQCSKKCHEPCDRRRCDSPCEKRLICKHPCIGLCGETCPRICRFCYPHNENFDIFFGGEDDNDARFIVLEDCGHIFEKNGLDHWMDVERGGRSKEGKIQLPKCPRCNTAIRKSLRYGAIVKQALRDIEDVKKCVIDQMRATLIKECDKLSTNIRTLFRQRTITQNQILDYFVKIRNCILKCDHLKLYIVLDLLNVFSRVYEHNEELWQNCTAHKNLLNSDLLERILQKNTYSGNDKWDKDCFVSLSQRCEISAHFFELTSQVNQDMNDLSIFKRLHNHFENTIIHNLNPTNPDANSLMLKCEIFLTNIRLKYRYQPLSAQEKYEIAQNVDVNRGGWFKCRNGHLYGIGDCGGATEIGKCPECGATIGGSAHQVASDNIYAGDEMGGTAQPAWPNQFGAGNNMFNLFD